LKGLEGFSHIQGIWWFDGCDNEIDNNQLITQKPYTEGPERLGTFATRSPARPNPIAITTWEIASIDYAKGIVKVYYIDALNGTPLLDIKPYTPSLDKVGNPTVPDWCKHWPKDLEGNRDFKWEKEFNFERND
jgi:tRNA-Thr(GGU) m(6)t(6)A37 methyltransferase TsaA